VIKAILHFILLLLFTQSVYWEIWWNVSKVNWDVQTFEYAKYLQFTISLKGSLLTENIKSYNDRISYRADWKYNVTKVKKNEEKLAIKLTNRYWNSVYFTNFDSSSSSNTISKRFHTINLIKENWIYKAVVWIYIHHDLDRNVARLLLNNDDSWDDVDDENFRIEQADLNLKSASYMFYWLRNKKIWRVIRLN